MEAASRSQVSLLPNQVQDPRHIIGPSPLVLCLSEGAMPGAQDRSLRATCPEEVGWAVTPQPNHRCRKEGHGEHIGWGLQVLVVTPIHSSRLGRHCGSTPKKSPSPDLYCPQIRQVYILSSREKVYVQSSLCWTGCERGSCLHTQLRLVPQQIPSTRSPIRSHFHSRRKFKCQEITLVDICLSGS